MAHDYAAWAKNRDFTVETVKDPLVPRDYTGWLRNHAVSALEETDEAEFSRERAASQAFVAESVARYEREFPGAHDGSEIVLMIRAGVGLGKVA